MPQNKKAPQAQNPPKLGTLGKLPTNTTQHTTQQSKGTPAAEPRERTLSEAERAAQHQRWTEENQEFEKLLSDQRHAAKGWSFSRAMTARNRSHSAEDPRSSNTAQTSAAVGSAPK